MTEHAPHRLREFQVAWAPFSLPALFLGAVAAAILQGLYLLSSDSDVRDPWGSSWILVAAALLLLSTLGTAIARILAQRLTRGEYATMREGVAFFAQDPARAIGPYLCPLFPLAVFGAGVFSVTLISAIPTVGPILSIVLMPFGIVGALACALLLIATVGSWWLSPGAIAVEHRAPFETIFKVWSYIFHRPLTILLQLAITLAHLYLIAYLFLHFRIVEVLMLRIAGLFTDQPLAMEPWVLSATTPTWEMGFALGVQSTWFFIWRCLVMGLILSNLIGSGVATFLHLRWTVDGVPQSHRSEGGEPTPLPLPDPDVAPASTPKADSASPEAPTEA